MTYGKQVRDFERCIKMISYDDFAELRLVQFAPGASIAQIQNWEFMDRRWVGEAIGFSEWLREQDSPNRLGSLALDFAKLPDSVCEAVLSRLDLPLRGGMSLSDIKRLLGEPIDIQQFIGGRTTYEFLWGRQQSYLVSCTVLRNGGLCYLVVMVKSH